MSLEPSVSVALACCNGERFIGAQVASILAQELPVHELVVCDDVSDDATVAIVTQLGRAATVPVRVTRHPQRLGVLQNFLSAFEQCRGSHIAYCDQDDVWSPARTLRMAPLLRQADCFLAFHPSAISNGDLSQTLAVAPTGLPAGAYDGPLPGGRLWGFGHQMIFRAEVAALARLLLGLRTDSEPDFFRNLDRLLLIAAGMLGRIYFIDTPLVQFRRHDKTVSDAGVVATAEHGSRLDRQRDSLVDQRQALRAWRAVLAEAGNATQVDAFLARLGGSVRRLPAYLELLERSERRLGIRMAMYERLGPRRGLGALLHSVALGNYGSVHQGKLPVKLLLADAAAAIRPSRGGRP